MLGLGKNMVEALGWWVEFFGVAVFVGKKRKPELTEFGEALFGAHGRDRFLEDEQSLWLLHWQATTAAPRRMFAWHWLFNVHAEPEFTRASALQAFKTHCATYARPLSDVTVRQHLDVFLGTYVASAPRPGAVAEDLLDSPLATLGLVREKDPGESAGGKEEAYVVDFGAKTSVTDELFRYCIHSWWTRTLGTEETCGYRQVCVAENSPGRVLKFPELQVHLRLQALVEKWPKEFQFAESNNQRQLRRLKTPQMDSLLHNIFDRTA